jgi:hypothetical protein
MTALNELRALYNSPPVVWSSELGSRAKSLAHKVAEADLRDYSPKTLHHVSMYHVISYGTRGLSPCHRQLSTTVDPSTLVQIVTSLSKDQVGTGAPPPPSLCPTFHVHISRFVDCKVAQHEAPSGACLHSTHRVVSSVVVVLVLCPGLVFW